MPIATAFPKLRVLLRNLLRRQRVDRELEAELNSTWEMLVEEKLAEGMPPEAARRAARRELGGIDQVKESVRDVRVGARLDRLAHDARAAGRALLAARGFTGAAIGTLTIGLTLCTVMLTVLNAYFVRGVPYPEADRLFSVQYSPGGHEAPRGLQQLDWIALDAIIEHTVAWDLDVFYLTDASRPEQAPGAWITPGFIDGFGVRPVVGRNFEREDFRSGRPQVALISHRLWQSRFGGDEGVVGRRFQAYVSDRPDEPETFTIVGVLPEGFWHLNAYTDVLVPLRAPTYPYFVRLRAGVPPDGAAERITALVRAGAQGVAPGWRVALESAQDRYVAAMRPVIRALTLAVGLVLLITCANVAMLFLVRAVRRGPEVALRLALGASRGQVARLLLFEGLLLGGAATAAALAGGRSVMAWLGPQVEQQLQRTVPGGLAGFELGGMVIAGTALCGLLGTLLFTAAPLAMAWRTSPSLARSGHAHADSAVRVRARSLLVVCEVAASLALLTGSVLLVSSAQRLLRVDFGIEAEQTIAASLSLRPRSYPDPDSRGAFFERLHRRLEEVPGFEHVALGNAWPLQQPTPEGLERESAGGVVTAEAAVIAVSAGYFDTLGVRLLEGRAVDRRDRWGTERVAMVSDTLARRLAPESSIVGERIRILRAPGAGMHGPEAVEQPAPAELLVVGVVGDVRQTHADELLADLYVPLLQGGPRFAWVLARVPALSPAWEQEIWAAVADIDASVALGSPSLLQTGVDEERARPRFLAALLSAFAGFAALLALLGVYSVISYAVRQRRREVAVRMAVGARPAAVARLFLQQGAFVLGAGLVLGIACALLVGRTLEGQLYGVRAGDPLVLLLTTLAFAGCGLLAIAWPALRATAIDPAVTLRAD